MSWPVNAPFAEFGTSVGFTLLINEETTLPYAVTTTTNPSGEWLRKMAKKNTSFGKSNGASNPECSWTSALDVFMFGLINNSKIEAGRRRTPFCSNQSTSSHSPVIHSQTKQYVSHSVTSRRWPYSVCDWYDWWRVWPVKRDGISRLSGHCALHAMTGVDGCFQIPNGSIYSRPTIIQQIVLALGSGITNTGKTRACSALDTTNGVGLYIFS